MTVLQRPVETAAPQSPAAPRPMTPVVVAAAAGSLAVLVLALLLTGGTAGDSALDRSGPLVDWGLPVVTLAGRVAALGTVGALLYAAVLLPAPGRRLPAASRGALRAASLWGLVWAALSVLSAVLTLSRILGTGPAAITWSAAATFVTDLPAGRSAVVVLAATLVIAVLARRSTRPATAAALLVSAGAALVVPAVLTGHSAAADHHVLAVTNLALHVVAATVWVGGLVALVVHGCRTADLATASARFSRLALICSGTVGASGLLAAWLILAGRPGGVGSVVGTGYGWLLTVKLLALLALGAFGWQHRRRTLPALRDGRPGAFRRFAAVEAGVMLATVAVAVALAASPPPPAAAGTAAPAVAPADDAPAADPMAGHDHGDLSVGVLADDTRFHVPAPVDAGSTVTVFNSGDADMTLTADDGSFEVDLPGHALTTFVAPAEPGTYGFGSRTDPAYRDVLVVE